MQEAEGPVTEPVAMRDGKKPGKPKLVKKTHNTIQLKWSKPENGAENIRGYAILFSDIDDMTDQWNTRMTQGAKESIVVDGLAAKTVYSFKVRAEYHDGICVEGDASDPIATEAHLAMEMQKMSKPLIASKDGHQSIYELPLVTVMENREHSLAKYSVGERKSHSPATEKVLMVVGATGAGKSTLINGMVNYIMGVNWRDKFRFKLITDDPTKVDQTRSVTKWITAYTIYQQEGSPLPYTVTIIDTPGFGDTEGLHRDKLITSQIRQFFSIEGPDGIDHVDGIGFVTQSSLARLTATQQYIFDSILSVFGRDIAKNIFLMVTFADGQQPPVVAAAAKAGIPFSDNFYKFNNSALFANNSSTDDDDDNFDKMFWKMGCISLKTFFDKFVSASSVSLQLTKEVLSEREQLEVILVGLKPQISAGLAKIEVMRQEEIALQQHEKEIATNKEFKFTVSVPKTRKVDLEKGRHVTNCIHCDFTCHQSCAYADDADKHMCCAMGSDGYCTVCPDHCHWQEHYNKPYIFEQYIEEETRTSDELKQKYDTAVDSKDKTKSIMAGLRQELEDVHTNVCAMMDKAQKCLNRLDQIALKTNPLTRVDYLELLIKSEQQQAQAGWKERVAYYEAAKEQAGWKERVAYYEAAKEQAGWKERVAYYEAAKEQATAITQGKKLAGDLKKFRLQTSTPKQSWYEKLNFLL